MSRQHDWRIAVCESGIDPTARLVALVLDTFMDKRGFAWPSRERIATRAGLSVRAVEQAITRLEDAGLLLVVHSRGRTSNRYQATHPNSERATPLRGSQQRTSRQPTANLTTSNGEPGSPEAVRKPSRKPKGVRGADAPPRSTELAVREQTAVDAGAGTATSAQTLVGFYVDRAHAAGVTNIPAQRRARVGQQVKRLLAEGIPPDVLELALQRMIDRTAQPSLLPDLVVDVQSPPPIPRESSQRPEDRRFRDAYGFDAAQLLERRRPGSDR
jgi:hypothetical protein